MQARLSVLILSPAPQTTGGVSTYTETLKAHLRTTEASSFWVGPPSGKAENLIQKLWRLVAVPFQVALLVHRNAYDAVHLNPSLNAKSALRDGLILFALILSGYRRTLVFFHGWDQSFFKRIMRYSILRSCCIFLLKHTAHIVVLAKTFKNDLIKIGIDTQRITVSRTMYDAKLFASSTLPRTSRPTILFMGRFDRRKGVHELLDAFVRIAPDFPDYDLVIAGEGAESTALSQRAKAPNLQNRVHFPGYVTGPAKTELLQQCTIFALPTYYPEGMPIVLIEAMAAGAPILTTAVGGISSLVHEPANGLILKNVTADTIETGLRRLLNDAKLRNAMAQHNNVAALHYEANNVTAEIEALYSNIALHEQHQ